MILFIVQTLIYHHSPNFNMKQQNSPLLATIVENLTQSKNQNFIMGYKKITWYLTQDQLKFQELIWTPYLNIDLRWPMASLLSSSFQFGQEEPRNTTCFHHRMLLFLSFFSLDSARKKHVWWSLFFFFHPSLPLVINSLFYYILHTNMAPS